MMNEIRAGTSGDDMFTAGNNNNVIVVHDGNDIINAGSGDDQICGGNGNDKINGEDGDDKLVGDSFVCKGEVGPGSAPGTDNITIGPGNDVITHGNAWYDYSHGNKDLLNCGCGDDTVILNITIDHDEAANCEHINPE
jgi:Ca2+-binding RTX toxin-like protein